MSNYCSEFFKGGVLVGLFLSLVILFIVTFFGDEIDKWIRKVLGWIG
jgi:hypothetical protein